MRHGDCVQFKVCVVDSRVQDCSGKCEPVSWQTDRLLALQI